MRWLIDAHNLMHVLGVMKKHTSLESSRATFLEWLADGIAARDHSLLVVFDAKSRSGKAHREQHRGIEVVFSTGETADDWIETYLTRERKPGTLCVVSNDNRVIEAGRRRGCQLSDCEGFIDVVLAGRYRKPKAATSSEVPAAKPALTHDEDDWLKVFGSQAKR